MKTRSNVSVFGRFFLLGIAGCILLAAPAQAQVLEATRQSEQILREQQLRREEDRRRMESQRPPAQIDMPAPAVPQGSGEGCWNIARVVIKGAAHMPAETQEEVTKKYTGKCLGVMEVQSLLSDITRFYIDKGYATTRAYLPQQDLSSKTLMIEVVEGKVGNIQLQKGDKGSLYLPNAFPGLKGEVMNLRDFEQGLDQLNRMPSNNATIDIAPGAVAGQSIITIRNRPTRRWHVNAGVDNYGTRNTGEQQANLTGSFDNLFGFNDLWSVTGRRSESFNNWGRHSNALNGFVSVPYGYTLFTLGWSASSYESELITAGPTLALGGTSGSGSFAVDHTLYRSQTDKLTFSGTMLIKRQENTIAGQKLDASSRPLTVLELGPNYSTNFLGGSGNVGLAWSRGLPIFGAYEDPSGTPGDAPHAQFDKFSLSASWSRPFALAGNSMTWSSQLTAQTSPDTLYGTEQISIGGLYTVRGFYEQSVANDTGAYIRNDLSLNENFTAWGRDFTARPYLALDAGDVSGRTEDTPHGTLVGAGIGLAITSSNVSFEIFTGRPLVLPDNFSDQGFHTFGRISVSF